MGDEPYAALLPWITFAVVDRAQGDGPGWAAVAAAVAAVTLLMTSRRESRPRSVIVVGAVVWFTAIAIAGVAHGNGSGLLGHDGRAVSAIGFSAIAFASVPFRPAMEYYTSPNVRPARRNAPAFRRVNVAITRVWGAAFVGIAVSHAIAASLGTREAYTVLNWIVPIALGTMAAHRSHVLWDDFNDDDPAGDDPLRDLALDWDRPTGTDT